MALNLERISPEYHLFLNKLAPYVVSSKQFATSTGMPLDRVFYPLISTGHGKTCNAAKTLTDQALCVLSLSVAFSSEFRRKPKKGSGSMENQTFLQQIGIQWWFDVVTMFSVDTLFTPDG